VKQSSFVANVMSALLFCMSSFCFSKCFMFCFPNVSNIISASSLIDTETPLAMLYVPLIFNFTAQSNDSIISLIEIKSLVCSPLP